MVMYWMCNCTLVFPICLAILFQKLLLLPPALTSSLVGGSSTKVAVCGVSFAMEEMEEGKNAT